MHLLEDRIASNVHGQCPDHVIILHCNYFSNVWKSVYLVQWYPSKQEQLGKNNNTFKDFTACDEYMYTETAHVSI